MADSNNSYGEPPPNKKPKPNMLVNQRKELATYFILRSKVGANGLQKEYRTISGKKVLDKLPSDECVRLYAMEGVHQKKNM